MPKIKTNRAAAKRFKLTGTGKIKRRKSGLRHILTPKGTDRKRALGKGVLVDKADVNNVRKMIPYS